MSACLPQNVDSSEIKRQDWLCRLAGLTSGLLLCVPAIKPAFVPLHLIALLPVFYLGARAKTRSQGMLVAGLYLGLAYTLPQLFILRLPVPMSALLLVWLTMIMVVITWTCGKLLNDSGILSAFAAGALLVVVDWLNFTALPIWGTAQSLARPWSHYPALIQFVSLTGITGTFFAFGSIQALAAQYAFKPKIRKKSLAAISVITLIILSANVVVQLQKPAGQLKVAAVGWTFDNAKKLGEIYSEQGFNALLAEPIADATRNGARLVVCPEGSLWFSENQKQDWLDKLSEITREHDIYLAIGYIDTTKNENRMMFISPEGEIIGEYTKTHLTYFEKFNKGTGQLVQIDVDGFAVGAMICQDDNFATLSRKYGKRGISLVAVPTWDWLPVKDVHLQNTIHRTIESRYAIVRAGLNGISAIVAPDGRVLAKKDHFKQGPGFIMAEVPLYSSITLFSRLGHWPVIPCIMFLAAYIGFKFKAAHNPSAPRTPV